MHTYTLCPTAEPEAAIAVESSDGAAALSAASRMVFREVDVFRDGAYAFSVRKQGASRDFWGIFHKPQLADDGLNYGLIGSAADFARA